MWVSNYRHQISTFLIGYPHDVHVNYTLFYGFLQFSKLMKSVVLCCTPYNGLYREALPKRGTFFRLQV